MKKCVKKIPDEYAKEYAINGKNDSSKAFFMITGYEFTTKVHLHLEMMVVE